MAIIIGTAGNDTIDGTHTAAGQPFSSTGPDFISGLDGNDSISGLQGNDIVSGGNGNDTLNGNGGNDSVYGEDGNDRIGGGVGDDLLSGGSGDDFLDGNMGANTLDGGAGTDTASYSAAPVGIIVDLRISGPQSIAGGLAFDTLIAIENLSGSSFDDTLIGDGND